VFHAVESSLGSFAKISPRSSWVRLFLLKLLLSSVAYYVEDLSAVVRLSERRGSMMFIMDCIVLGQLTMKGEVFKGLGLGGINV